MLFFLIIICSLLLIAYMVGRRYKVKQDALNTIKYVLSNTYEQYEKELKQKTTCREALNVKILISELHKNEKNLTEKGIYKKLRKYYTEVSNNG